MKNHANNTAEVTLVITSCGRLDLLDRSISSFLKFNTYPIKHAILIEDSGDRTLLETLAHKYGDRFEILFNEPKLWHIRSVDAAYSRVATDYVFHCQDDWEFYRAGFIEDSLSVLSTDPKILQAWLRHKDDTNRHPIVGKIMTTPNGVQFRQLEIDHYNHPTDLLPSWHGFSFNPGLKRMADYRLIGSYASNGNTEMDIGKIYRKLGYYATILAVDAVRHIGWGRHTQLREPQKDRLMRRIHRKVNHLFRAIS